jgi:OmpA-OmpF porin, OOP family
MGQSAYNNQNLFKKKLFYLLLAAFFSLPVNSYCQLNLGEKIKDATNNRINQKTDEAIEKSLDAVENSIEESVKNNGESSDTSTSDKSQEKATSNKTKTSPQTTSADLKSFSKYDFVPGDKILFFEDFSQDAIGDFPALWTTNGSGEVKTVNIASGNWFHMNQPGSLYCLIQEISFPTNFIMEFDFIPDENIDHEFELTFYEDDTKKEMNDALYPGAKGLHIYLYNEGWNSRGYSNEVDAGSWAEGGSKTNPVIVNHINHVIIWVQGRRLRVYHSGAKVLDMPTNVYTGSKFNRLRFSSEKTDCKPFISNIKITTAAPDTRSKLLTEGKLVSYGIYFDVSKDVVKAESYGTLNDIAKVLKDNPAVRVKIVGHTDADGADADNLNLSKRRAAAVKNELVKSFGIDASRIETDGKGESQPIAPNNTPANKALNRRVEFIKL